ncbi:hypothetical protein [Paenibacillus sp. sgz302251]|uniref:hypothetical protein n=1 Tax=Paenibacillus sp. sgz302251 TaxID=3414493 RepID=UPI003C79E036
MAQGWVTMLVLAFGIMVAVIGVIAYLRMFRKDRLAAASQPGVDAPPPQQAFAANTRDHELHADSQSEQATTKD